MTVVEGWNAGAIRTTFPRSLYTCRSSSWARLPSVFVPDGERVGATTAPSRIAPLEPLLYTVRGWHLGHVPEGRTLGCSHSEGIALLTRWCVRGGGGGRRIAQVSAPLPAAKAEALTTAYTAGIPSVRSTFAQASGPPRTSSTFFRCTGKSRDACISWPSQLRGLTVYMPSPLASHHLTNQSSYRTLTCDVPLL
jgi:hypothetical protein